MGELVWLIVEGDTINTKMVEDGFAWWYEYYCGENKVLERYQAITRINELGLWSESNPTKYAITITIPFTASI